MRLRARTVLIFSLFILSVHQGYAEPSEDKEDKDLEALINLSLEELMEIKISVGTRGEGRTLSQSPIPVQVITAAQIERTGYAELNKILQRLLPSFNFPRSSVVDGTDHARPFTLRGMGSDQVLVLINGKRLHPGALVHLNDSIGRGSTGVDLNTIPARAIERIEVLRDGAAAQYGSDAIAGILNIVLKSAEEARVTGTMGQTAEGDGDVRQIDLNYGFSFLESGFFHISAEYRDRKSTNRAGPDTRQQYFDGDPRNEVPGLNDQVTFRIGDPEAQDLLLMLNGKIPLSDRWSLYFFGGADYRESEAAGFFRRPLDNRTVRTIYPDGFLPLIAPDIWDGSLTLGSRGGFGSAWTWDLSNTTGVNSYAFHVANSLNTSMGAESPTSFDNGTLIFVQSTTTLDFFKPLDIGLPRTLRTGFGLEHRFENYRISSGDEASYIQDGVPVLDGPGAGEPTPAGSQVFPGFKPENETDESRHNLAVYVDLENNLTEELLASAAGRYEYYDDFGSTLDGKLALAYQPFEPLVLRGSTSTGFRAPSLAQSYFTSTATVFIEHVPFEVGTFSVDHPLARALGATDLKAEKSYHASAGASFHPLDNLVISADYFFTHIDDRIVLSGDINQDPDVFGQEVVDLLASYGVGGARFFTNAIDTRTQGVDLSVRYDWDLGRWGRLDLSSLYHFNRTEIVGDVRAPSMLGAVGEDVILDRQERERYESGQPRHNLILSAAYQVRRLNLALRCQRFGSVKVVHDLSDPSADQTLGAKWLTDLDISYKVDESLCIALGGHNIFDVNPDYNTTFPDNPYKGKDGIFRYSHQASPFGFNGGFYYVRLGYEF